MTLTLLAAVDVAGGRAVRLDRGNADTATEHGDPLDVARGLQRDGAELIHLVDLDAAFGRGSNAEMLTRIVGELDVDVQLSGGVTDAESLTRALATRCARVNIGTQALLDPSWCSQVVAEHGERVALGLDVTVVHHLDDSSRPDGQIDVHHRGDTSGSRRAADRHLAARGSTDDARVQGDLWETIDQLDRAGCARYVVTDVDRDGMLDGPNVELYRDVLTATPTPVIASGGISSIGDLELLAALSATVDNGATVNTSTGARLDGVVLGTALSNGRFALRDALAAARRVADASGRTR